MMATKPASMSASSLAATSPKIEQFEQIRKECVRRRQRYEDPDFPANDQSIYYSSQPGQKFEWLRPDQICFKYQLKPELIRMGSPTMRFDVVQGEYGDCWLVSAFAAISENEELLFRVCPRNQSFQDDWYAGMFRFRIWRGSQWEDVIIDDRLPTINGQLVFIHSQSVAEFWPALLEKAFAKLYGSYEAMKSALMPDSLTDLTGGITETYILHGQTANLPKNIINVMFKALERESIISCNMQSTPRGSSGPNAFQPGQRLPNGLILGHTYCVTDLREIRLITQTGEIPFVLVRLRNPWGQRVDWNGAWSDRSEEWQSIPEEDRREMGLVVRGETEFWMEFHDFLSNFDELTLSNLAPDAPVRTPRRWSGRQFNGRWIRGANSGGRPECRETHWTNPQVRVWLRELDDDEEGLCSLIVELAQKDERGVKYRAPNYAHLGFAIYQLPPGSDPQFTEDGTALAVPQSPQSRSFFDSHQIIAHSGCFANSRQVTRRFLLAPGDYLLVLSTFEPNTAASFSVRCFFEKPGNTCQLLENDADLINPQASLLGPPLTLSESLSPEQHEQLRWLFYEQAGEDMRISVSSLPQTLAAACQNEFQITEPTARCLSLLVDNDRTGFVDYQGFAALFRLVNQWKRAWFENRSTDRMGLLEAHQLGPALLALGFKLPSRALAAILLLYASDQQKMCLSLDAFLCVAAKLYQAGSTYQKLQHNGRLVLSLNQWLEESLAA